ncbi:hypothetical protein [Komagataeibacter sp. NFXK3]
MAESCQATTRLVMRLQAARPGGLSAAVARLPGRGGAGTWQVPSQSWLRRWGAWGRP